MIIDNPESQPQSPHEATDHTGRYIAIFVVLAALAAGEIYILSRMKSFETDVAQAQKQMFSQLQDDLSTKISAVERSNAAQLEEFKNDLDNTAKHVQLAGGVARHARLMVTKLQKQQQQQADELKQEIAQKADQQQVGAITKDVADTKSDLDNTKKAVEATRNDLGMARSEFGTLIARNHDEIEQLRKLGERDYFEFTLKRGQTENVAGVGLLLKRTNLKRHRFTLAVVADDMQVEKKDRTINEPIFFSVKGSKSFYELVVNKVQSNVVTGYISTPKGATEVASRTEGGR